MGKRVGLLAMSLLPLMLAGCFGGGVTFPIECVSNYPLADYIYRKDSWGPLNIGSSRHLNPSSNPLTKDDFLSEFGKPDEIVSISTDKEMWVYNRSANCGITPMWLVPVPLVFPVCDAFDHITFEKDKAVYIHFRRDTGVGGGIVGLPGYWSPKQCPADFTPSGIDAKILPTSPDVISIPHTEECRQVTFRDGIIWWTDGNDIIKIAPYTLEVIGRISVAEQLDNALDLTAMGFGAVWLKGHGRKHDILSRIDLATGKIMANIPLNNSVGPIVTGEDAVWVLHGKEKLLSRIDPQTNQVTATIPLEHNADLIATGEGSVWVLLGDKEEKLLSRIDPQTNQIAATIPIGLNYYAKIKVGYGSVWVASLTTVLRIDPQTNQVEAFFPVLLDTELPVNYYSIMDMSPVLDTLWVLEFKGSKGFFDDALQFGLAEIETKTNNARSIKLLGSASGYWNWFESASVAATDDAIWVCLPLGIYVVPIAKQQQQ